MSAIAGVRTQCLQRIAKRWPRSAWDYRGLSRWLSFDASYWTAVLAMGLLFSTAYVDVLLWAPGAGPLPIVGELGESRAGRVLLVVLVLLNGWVVDRLLAARTPADLREVRRVRVSRAILAAIPLLGLAMVPLWQRLTRNRPLWAFATRPKTALELEENLPAGLGLVGLRTRMDSRLRAWSQRLILQIAWLVGCQITPWFSGLYLLGRGRTLTAVIVCVFLHLAGAGAALAHSALRSSLLQMTPGRALAFRLLPLGLLLPVPLSFLPLLLWLLASEDSREDKGVIQTLYRARSARRHPFATTRRPRQEEILGETEHRRRQAAAGKILLLFLESAALSRLAAAFGFFLLPVWAIPDQLLLLLLALAAIPGIALLLGGAAGRNQERFPRLAALANHPSVVSLILVPLVFLLGVLSGVLDASKQPSILAALLLMIGFLGAFATFLTAMWSFVMSLFFGAPDRPYAGKVVTLFLFLMAAALSIVVARLPVFLGLTSAAVLASPLVGIVIAARWLAPFRFRDLKDPRLPANLRFLLRAIALSAILPLGGLALPWLGELWHRRGPDLDRWAVRLRELPALKTERYPSRAAEVWRRHRPIGRDMSGRRSWVNLTHENGATLGVMMFVILQLILEPALWWDWPPWSSSRKLFGSIALGLLVVAPVSGLLLERYLAHRKPPQMVLRPMARLAVWFLGSIPLAGYLLVPLARRWMENASFRAWRPEVAALNLDSPPVPLPRGSLRQWAYVSGAFGIWLAVTGVLLPIAGCFWLAAVGQRTAILAACAVLHLAQAGCIVLYARSDPRFTQQSGRRLRLASWFCLLPQPVALLALILWAETGPRQETLTWSAYAQAGSVRRHSRWLDLRLALQQRWQTGSWIERWTQPKGLELPQRNGRTETARRTWVRAKALLLPVEASLAIGWLAALTGSGPEPSYDPIRDPGLRPWLWATSLLATLGLLQAATGSLARLLRLRHPALLGPPAAGLHLFITQAALCFALLAGPLAARGKFRDLALLAVLGGALAMALSFLLMAPLSLLASRPGNLVDSITWSVGLFLVGSLPLLLGLFPAQATIIISALTLVTLLTGFLLAWRYLPWILHPFTFRDLFDGRFEPGSRTTLALLALIVLFPFGGLGLPLWLWWSRREPLE